MTSRMRPQGQYDVTYATSGQHDVTRSVSVLGCAPCLLAMVQRKKYNARTYVQHNGRHGAQVQYPLPDLTGFPIISSYQLRLHKNDDRWRSQGLRSSNYLHESVVKRP